LIFAVITNRTLLWKYHDRSTCERVGEGHASKICIVANTPQDCSLVLHRHEWIPSFDEWNATKLLLGSNNMTIIETLLFSNTKIGQMKKSYPPKMIKTIKGNQQQWYTGIDAPRISRVVGYGQILGQDAGTLLKNENKRRRFFLTVNNTGTGETTTERRPHLTVHGLC
jgi:hypothetical protein